MFLVSCLIRLTLSGFIASKQYKLEFNFNSYNDLLPKSYEFSFKMGYFHIYATFKNAYNFVRR